MAIERNPKSPVSRTYIPPNSSPYRVHDGESWISIADKHGMDPATLIYANFKTVDPPEVNWYLNNYVGCKKTTRDGRNWMFSSSATPGIIHIPHKVIEMPPMTIVGNPWQKISFWLELNTGDLWVYKKVRGVVGMRINQHPTDWYAWNISASLLCANLPIKGSPPIGVSAVNSTEKTFDYNPALLNPEVDWKTKGVFVRLAGDYAWIRIKEALPKKPNPKYQPIKGVTTRDLVIKVKVDSPQIGWCSGVGGIEDGRTVKPIARPRPMTHDGQFPRWN